MDTQFMKKKNYLTYLNNNYFYEIGFEKKESKLKDLKIKKERQYRSSQGRPPRQRVTNNKMFGWSLLGLIITFIIIFITKK
jgi:hypothetical protein|tara:strand:+ start:2396 stop:2638 length:243 start_codon:yes stop_codon:yes gene_type:complete